MPVKRTSSKVLSCESVFALLRRKYVPPRTFLTYRTPLDLLVATVLSAQCTDVRVNHVTQTILYPKYHTPKDYLRVPRKELEADIYSCGTYKTKAKYIQGLCSIIIKKHKNHVPQTMEELIALPGVGRKTASIILWACFGKNEGIAVDTHVFRVARRLGLARGKTPEKVEMELMKRLPRKQWGRLTTLLISHGRAVCTARSRTCDQCPFQKQCPSSWVMGRRDRGIRT